MHDKVTPGENAPQIVNVIIEIPKGSSNKYEFDKELGLVVLDRVQPSAMKQPYDYGFVPQTLSDDGDPLDALVVMDEPLFPGVLVAARPVGVLQMLDDGEGDEKLICVASNDMNYEHVLDLSQLGEHFKDKVAHYFERYKDLQGKKVEVTGWGDVTEAHDVIKQAVANYHK